ncbi:MAG: AI-2E family transporter [Moorea sp. SIO3I7]|uniref:Uncharacterized protein n=1 Tax=Moorena bouillonii PNG TaxID=568701 RepID=A0A1U7N6F0_9CYAN|nr:AI-2E family transporter [Moorena bouillonii]NEO03538.1 AI-2E family transporter [Moorena sp. SIO3I7]OLT61521.1 hypothetical protein BJP37_23430 [Moorena bouillonii PNG]
MRSAIFLVSVGLQQIKDNFIAPRVLRNLTGLSPVIIFVYLLLGVKLGGLLRVILAITLTGVVKSLVEIIRESGIGNRESGIGNS